MASAQTVFNGSRKRKRNETGSSSIENRKIVLIVAYLGKNYHGSARNDCADSVPTVEGRLWKAIGQAYPNEKDQLKEAKLSFMSHIQQETHPKAMTRSSRTDKGVSALGNVFSLSLPWAWETEQSFSQRVNHHLPEDIRLLRAMKISQSFHARTNCEARRYRYFVPAHVLRHPSASEEESIMDLRKRLKKVLLQWGGTHSFHNFTNWKAEYEDRSDTANDPTTIQQTQHEDEDATDQPTFFRHILRCHVEDVLQHNETEFVVISIKGQSFVYHQIRKMMGATIGIMNQSLPADFISTSLKEDTTNTEAPLAPSEGLVMVEAIYSKFCSKHKLEPIGLGTKLLYRHDAKKGGNGQGSWETAKTQLEADTLDFQKRVYEQVFQDQIKMFPAP